MIPTALAQAATEFVGPPAPTTAEAPQTIAEFFGGFYSKLLIIIFGLAVLAIAYWGLFYMVSLVPGIKSVSKQRILNAIYGLLLALAAYLILKTINPGILSSVDNLLQDFVGSK